MPEKKFDKIYTKFTEEEKKFLAELSDKERREALEFFCNPLEELPIAEREKYTPEEVRRILRKNIKTPLELTEDELDFVMMHPELVRKASIHTIKPFHDIAAKLDDIELEILKTAANKNPALFTYKPPVTPTPPPVVKPPPAKVPPEVEKEVVEEVEKIEIKKAEEIERIPYKWRTQFPFKTSTFIRQFLIMRGDKGAYPYEIYKAYKISLWKLITDGEYRKKIIKDEGLKFDGEMIDGILSAQIERNIGNLIRQCPGIHVASYQSFWKYFFILDVLELIRRRDTKIPISGLPMTFTRQYYEIVPERIDDTVWEHPQEILYPLSWLGANKINQMLKDHREELEEKAIAKGITMKRIGEMSEEEINNLLKGLVWENIIDFFIEDYPDKLKEIAEERGITVEELESIMREKRYIPEGKKKELMQRRREDLKREEKYLREKG